MHQKSQNRLISGGPIKKLLIVQAQKCISEEDCKSAWVYLEVPIGLNSYILKAHSVISQEHCKHQMGWNLKIDYILKAHSTKTFSQENNRNASNMLTLLRLIAV